MAKTTGAPFKRGQKLTYARRIPHGDYTVEVTYIKWMGFERSSLIVVKFADGTKATVHVDDCKEVK